MKISDRLTDYALVGGFFWILQSAAMIAETASGNTRWTNLLQSFEASLKDMPPGALSPLSALLGALALITIFVTGLLLDLFGSFSFRDSEMGVFIRCLHKNKRWLQRLSDQNEDYFQDDMATLLNALPMLSKKQLLVGLEGLGFWKSKFRHEYAKAVRDTWLAPTVCPNAVFFAVVRAACFRCREN
jgi:hypothetical protein